MSLRVLAQLVAVSNDIDDLLPLVPATNAVLSEASAGTVIRVPG